MSINDGCLLASTVFIVLKSHFKDHVAYHDLVEAFRETAFQIELGQSYDLLTATRHYGGLAQFTREKYEFIIERKTAYYTSYTPISLPVIYLQLATPKNLKEVYKVALSLSQYYQVRNDHLDVYGDPAITRARLAPLPPRRRGNCLGQIQLGCTPSPRVRMEM
jgi:farnesyl diphosphate synthase